MYMAHTLVKHVYHVHGVSTLHMHMGEEGGEGGGKGEGGERGREGGREGGGGERGK